MRQIALWLLVMATCAPLWAEEPKAAGLEQFKGMAWGTGLAEVKAAHPEMRCGPRDTTGPYGDVACKLSPTAAEEKAQQEATERSLKGKGKLASRETDPFVTVFFRDDKQKVKDKF